MYHNFHFTEIKHTSKIPSKHPSTPYIHPIYTRNTVFVTSYKTKLSLRRISFVVLLFYFIVFASVIKSPVDAHGLGSDMNEAALSRAVGFEEHNHLISPRWAEVHTSVNEVYRRYIQASKLLGVVASSHLFVVAVWLIKTPHSLNLRNGAVLLAGLSQTLHSFTLCKLAKLSGSPLFRLSQTLHSFTLCKLAKLSGSPLFRLSQTLHSFTLCKLAKLSGSPLWAVPDSAFICVNLRNWVILIISEGYPRLFIHSLCANLRNWVILISEGYPRLCIHSLCVNLRNWVILISEGYPRLCILSFFSLHTCILHIHI